MAPLLEALSGVQALCRQEPGSHIGKPNHGAGLSSA